MKVKVDDIDIYNDSAIILERKAPSKVFSWIIILLITSSIAILISFIPFSIYESYYGVVKLESDNSFIIFDLEYMKFPINKYDKLYIKNKSYNYDVFDISENSLIIKLDLEDGLKIDNNIVVVNILKDRTSIFNILKNKIKKGFDL